jgi:hypothetical protein
MDKHLDPVFNVYIDLDKFTKAELYDDYAKLVEKYRDLRAHANDLLNVIDGECDRDVMCEFNLDDVVAYETFRDDPDNYTQVSPSIYSLILDEDGNALRREDK